MSQLPGAGLAVVWQCVDALVLYPGKGWIPHLLVALLALIGFALRHGKFKN